MQQDTINGLLTLEYGIQNHVLTSLSTMEGAWQNRQQLKEYRHSFYQQAIKQAKKQKIDGYLISEGKDKYRLHALLDKLSQHQAEDYLRTCKMVQDWFPGHILLRNITCKDFIIFFSN